MKTVLGAMVTGVLALLLLVPVSVVQTANAASAQEIDIKANAALERFRNEVGGGAKFLDSAEGVLVFPEVLKAGFVVGGEYGEGVLRIGGASVDYYSTAAASIGFQLGAQSKMVFLVFLEKSALDAFRASEGWKAGVDGSVAVVEFGAGTDVTTLSIQDPIVGFVLGNKGLMFNLTLEGSKYTRLKK